MKIRLDRTIVGMTTLLVLVLFLSGCWNKQAWGIRSDEFMKTSIRYRSAVRWGEYDKAFAYIKKRSGEAQEPDLDYLKTIEVTDYKILKRTSTPGTETIPEEVRVTVEIDFVREGSPSVNQIKMDEVWWFDEKSEKWYLDGDLPDFAKSQ